VDAAEEEEIGPALQFGTFLGKGGGHAFVIGRGLVHAVADVDLTLRAVGPEGGLRQALFLGAGEEDGRRARNDLSLNQFPVNPVADGLEPALGGALEPRVQHAVRIDEVRRHFIAQFLGQLAQHIARVLPEAVKDDGVEPVHIGLQPRAEGGVIGPGGAGLAEGVDLEAASSFELRAASGA
jgi:hypothetical protein